jgi:large subunit ribosomal protein L21
MFAIVNTGGKQYKVEPESEIQVEKIEGKKGDEIVFPNVIAVEKMGKLSIGQPYVKGAKVLGVISSQGLAKKVIIFKYKAKKGVRTKNGHRQPFTRVKIKEIVATA